MRGILYSYIIDNIIDGYIHYVLSTCTPADKILHYTRKAMNNSYTDLDGYVTSLANQTTIYAQGLIDRDIIIGFMMCAHQRTDWQPVPTAYNYKLYMIISYRFSCYTYIQML